jgi:hypothetical protein
MRKILVFWFLMINLINLVYAFTIEIEIRDSFYFGEEISFLYTLNSPFAQEVDYVSYILCPNIPNGFPMEQSIHLDSDEPYINAHTDQIVKEWFESQNCVASIHITQPINLIVSKNFSIITNPSMVFNLILSKKVFILGESTIINYSSPLSDLNIEAKLTSPDGKTKEISFPYSFNADKIGTYILEVIASKEGYKTISKREQFGVIESEARIETFSYVPIAVTEKGSEEDKTISSMFLIIIGFIILIILILLIIAGYKLKKKKEVTLQLDIQKA